MLVTLANQDVGFKKMRRKYSILFVFLLSFTTGFSQELSFLDSLNAPKFIDTLFIDRDIHNWSVRIFTNYKQQRFRLSDANNKLTYVPNNPAGIGFGLATKKVILDLAFNIKTNKEEPSDRFDMQGSLTLEKHNIDFVFQRYKGFNVVNDRGDQEVFREDLSSNSSYISYMYLFNSSQYSVSALKTGLSRQKKAALSFSLGGLFFMNNKSADSTIVPQEVQPQFNEEAQIKKLNGIGLGIIGGVTTIFPLPFDFFISFSLVPGIGIMYKRIETENLSYTPSNPMQYSLDMAGAFGYNGHRIYVNITTKLGIYGSDLDYGNKSYQSGLNAKLSVGYKIKPRPE